MKTNRIYRFFWISHALHQGHDIRTGEEICSFLDQYAWFWHCSVDCINDDMDLIYWRHLFARCKAFEERYPRQEVTHDGK